MGGHRHVGLSPNCFHDILKFEGWFELIFQVEKSAHPKAMWQKAVKVYMVASLSTYVQSMLQQNKNKYEQLVGGLNPS